MREDIDIIFIVENMKGGKNSLLLIMLLILIPICSGNQGNGTNGLNSTNGTDMNSTGENITG